MEEMFAQAITRKTGPCFARKSGGTLFARPKGAFMSQKILLAVAVVWFSGSVTMAQNTSTPLRAPKTENDMRIVTVTGCLERGPQAGSFLLSRVPDPLTDSVAAAAGSAVPTITYQLSGGQNLAPHLGHRVEITGKTPLKPQAPVKVADAETKHQAPVGNKTATTEVKEKAAISVRPLAVDSVRMISTDCAGK